MFRYLKIIPSLLIVILAFEMTAEPAAADEADLAATARDNTAFACDLYRQLRAEAGNLFFSPYSISTSLAMTWAGARGETEAEMRKVLHFPADQASLHRAIEGLQAHMDEIGRGGACRLRVANSLWCQQGFELLEPFVDICGEHYGTGVHFVDFVGRTEAARKKINIWVARKTANRIKDMLAPGVLTAETRLALCNAIYFKGTWAYPFEAGRTRDGMFFVASDRSVTARMMHQNEKLRILEREDFAALELPYAGNDLSMVILLPTLQDGLADLERKLAAEFIDTLLRSISGTSKASVDVTLPKFVASDEFELTPTLSRMGMPRAFTDADFSGVNGKRDLFISNVVHKAFVAVDEEGTEAAAATVVVETLCSYRCAAFHADHPFIYLIRENSTGSVLFMGRVVDPTE